MLPNIIHGLYRPKNWFSKHQILTLNLSSEGQTLGYVSKDMSFRSCHMDRTDDLGFLCKWVLTRKTTSLQIVAKHGLLLSGIVLLAYIWGLTPTMATRTRRLLSHLARPETIAQTNRIWHWVHALLRCTPEHETNQTLCIESYVNQLQHGMGTLVSQRTHHTDTTPSMLQDLRQADSKYIPYRASE